MAHFRFRLIFEISRQIIDRWQLVIAQIGAYDLIKIFDFTSWGHLRVFGVIWGQNPNIFKPRQIIYQNEAFGPVIKKKLFPMSS